MRAAIYTRISHDATGEAAGVKRQQADCEQLAQMLGWEIVESYPENDTSAMSDRRRPQFERMLADVESGVIDAVVCWHPDRLYRKTEDLIRLVKLCDATGLSIRSVRAGDLDISTATGKLFAKILGVIGEYEGEHKAERWNRSFRQAREEGRLPRFGHSARTGMRAFGWTVDGELIPHEADLIRQAATDLVAGKSLRAICRDWNDAGIRTTRGNPWQPAALRYLLRNPRLAGHSVIHNRKAGTYDIVGRGDWQPILDDDAWELVRALLTARSTPPPVRVSLLAGLAYCGECEKRLVTGNEKGRRIYRCIRRPDSPESCGRIWVTADHVDAVAEGVARRVLSRPEVRRWMAEHRTGNASHLLKEIDTLENRLLEIERTIDSGVESVEMLARSHDRIKARIGELGEKLAAATPVPVPEDVEVDWPTDLGARRRLVDLVVARVWVDPAKIRGGRFDPSRVRVDPTDGVRDVG